MFDVLNILHVYYFVIQSLLELEDSSSKYYKSTKYIYTCIYFK